jgi:hypothetical protein
MLGKFCLHLVIVWMFQSQLTASVCARLRTGLDPHDMMAPGRTR